MEIFIFSKMIMSDLIEAIHNNDQMFIDQNFENLIRDRQFYAQTLRSFHP